MDEATREAVDRLLILAKSDTGQAGRIANFLLAWWNAEELGGFDIAELFTVDGAIARDMARVFSYLATRSNAEYPEDRESDIREIIRRWRPVVWAKIEA